MARRPHLPYRINLRGSKIDKTDVNNKFIQRRDRQSVSKHVQQILLSLPRLWTAELSPLTCIVTCYSVPILAFWVQSATPACQRAKEVETYRQLFSVSADYTAHAGDSPNRHFLFPTTNDPRPKAMCAKQPICRLNVFDLAWVKEHCKASIVRTSNIQQI